MEFTDIANLIRTRRSIRAWQDKKVPEQLLIQAVELATWAPNGGNRQNWHFYIIMNRDTIKTIADVVQDRADQITSWPEAEKFGGAAASWRQRVSFFRTAPAAIAVGAAPYQSEVDQTLAAREKTDPQARRMRRWRNIADSRIQSVAASIAYLLLVLHQMDLGAVWMTGPILAKEEIEEILQVTSRIDVVALIPVGYPAEDPDPKERHPVGHISEIIRGLDLS